jgi:hypothetical protein
MRTPTVLVLISLALVATGCPKDEKKSEASTASKDEKADDSKKDDDAKGKKKAKKGDDDDKKGDDKKADDDDKGGDDKKSAGAKVNDADDPSAVPGTRSKAPTKAEVDAAPDVAVEGAKELGCETRMVREWFQIACRGQGAKAPTFVVVDKGKTKDTLVATIPGVSMSVKTPYEPGAEPLEATFYWADKAQTLKMEKWTLKKARPETLGKMTASTDKGLTSEKAAYKHYCACKAASGAIKCDNEDENGNVDCFRTFWADCGKMVACQNMEPGVVPTCLPGFVNAGISGAICAKDCAKDAKCPKGQSCQDTLGGKKACME